MLMLDELTTRIAKVALDVAIESVRRMQDSPRFIIWTWDTIKGFGATKALKTSYVFLFLVPVVARALQSAPDTVHIPFSSKEIPIALELPFSWTVLFFSACLASLGNIIYAMMCPKLVKEFADYPEYRESQRDGSHLRETVHMLALTARKGSLQEQIQAVSDLYQPAPVDLYSVEQAIEGPRQLAAKEFYFVRDSANLAKPLIRLAASLAYFGAFLCLAIIAIQNVYYVVSYLVMTPNAG